MENTSKSSSFLVETSPEFEHCLLATQGTQRDQEKGGVASGSLSEFLHLQFVTEGGETVVISVKSVAFAF
jgi:hypothetical protein